jgi:hypothetical protein
MFKVVEYTTQWKKNPRAPEMVPTGTKLKVLAKFPTLDAARKFAEGKDKTVIQYPKNYLKEMNK